MANKYAHLTPATEHVFFTPLIDILENKGQKLDLDHAERYLDFDVDYLTKSWMQIENADNDEEAQSIVTLRHLHSQEIELLSKYIEEATR